MSATFRTRSWIPTVLLLGALLFSARQAAAGTIAVCEPKGIDVGDGDDLAVRGYVGVDHVEKGPAGTSTTVPDWKPGAKWTPSDTEKLKAQGTDRVWLVFAKADQSMCAQEVRPKQNLPVVTELASETEGTFEGCREAGTKWAGEIARQSGGTRSTIIVFMNSGEICYSNRLQAPEGQPIYVGIYAEASDRWEPVQFTPCSLQDAAPAIFVGSDKVRLSGTQTQKWSLAKIAPRTCFNESVAIKASGTVNNAPAQIAFEFLQYRLYRATLQLGAVFTTQHGSDFGVVTNAAGQTVIHDSAATGRGPEYVISLVIYGLPHYLYSFVGGPAYQGRDILHQQGWADRIGLVTGVGLTDPTRRFVLGASLEVMYGLNVLFVGQAFQRSELDGVAVTNVFAGAASDIPTHDVWHTTFVLGLSLDLRYVQEIFSGRVHP